MKETIIAFMAHRNLQFISLGLGTFFSGIFSFFMELTPLYFFGISASLWMVAFAINLVDISTGIKADTKRKKDVGENFRFESRRGWRAFEKIAVFTLIIWFLYELELESLRLKTWEWIFSTIQVIKFSMLFYVVLIELQSIGENEEVRFGKKGKMFKLLDDIIAIVNDGILQKLKSFFETKE